MGVRYFRSLIATLHFWHTGQPLPLMKNDASAVKKKTRAYCMSEHAISKMKFLESKFYLRMTDVLLHHINACLHICRKCPFVLSGYMPVCLSICLFVCVYQHRSHWIDFHEVWYWWLLWKSSQENPYLIKIGQNSGALYLNEVWFIVASDVKLS